MTRKQKLVKEWMRARIAAGQGISKSLRMYAQNVGIATELALPPCEPTKSLPEKSAILVTSTSIRNAISGWVSDAEPCEFSLPDEERFYPLSYYDCPLCNSEARLWRSGAAGKPKYQVQCINKSCGHKTGWQKSSSEATRIWKVTSLLHHD